MYDNDGTGGVMNAPLADRAEKEIGHHFVSARANDEEISRASGAHQGFSSVALYDLAFDLDALRFDSDVTDRPVEQVFGCSLPIGLVCGIWLGKAFDEPGDIPDRPGMDCSQRRVS